MLVIIKGLLEFYLHMLTSLLLLYTHQLILLEHRLELFYLSQTKHFALK